MVVLRLTLLGGFQARLGAGVSLNLPARKVQALVAYLGLRPGEPHLREKLATLLWGDRSEERARDGLRHALSALRKALPRDTSPMLLQQGQTLALNPSAVEVDVVTFERRVAEGSPEALEHAAEIYRGDLLLGFSVDEPLFEDWLVAERERLRESALEALARLLAHQVKTATTERAIQTAVRLLALDPLQEVVHCTLMRLYARQRRRGAALRQYHVCAASLRHELGTEPEPATRQLYEELLRPSSPASRKASRTRSSSRSRATPAMAEPPDPSAPLFGRDADRARLAAALDDVSRGRAQLIALMGEAGVGKTRLLAAAAADARSRRARVLLGRCYESTQILPFGPWIDACRAGGITAAGAGFGPLEPVWRAELARLFPELARTGLPPPSADGLRLFEAVARLVERLADGPLLMVAFEDAHWADEMSLRLLAFLSRRIASHVLFVVTGREEELAAAPGARRILDELTAQPGATRMALAPLTRPATIALIRSQAGAGGAAGACTRIEEDVWAVSEGNPFVVVETMRALRDGTIPAESTSLPLADPVRAMIEARLERLSEPARRLAAAAAVIGEELEFSLMQRASGLDDASATEGVEELVRRHVLHRVGDRFAFARQRFRAVVYARLLPPRRELLHRSAVAAEKAGGSRNVAPDPPGPDADVRWGEV